MPKASTDIYVMHYHLKDHQVNNLTEASRIIQMKLSMKPSLTYILPKMVAEETLVRMYNMVHTQCG